MCSEWNVPQDMARGRMESRQMSTVGERASYQKSFGRSFHRTPNRPPTWRSTVLGVLWNVPFAQWNVALTCLFHVEVYAFIIKLFYLQQLTERFYKNLNKRSKCSIIFRLSSKVVNVKLSSNLHSNLITEINLHSHSLTEHN